MKTVVKIDLAKVRKIIEAKETLENDVWLQYARGSGLGLTQKQWEKRFPGLEYHCANGKLVQDWAMRKILLQFGEEV